jgi:hypothetical protein
VRYCDWKPIAEDEMSSIRIDEGSQNESARQIETGTSPRPAHRAAFYTEPDPRRKSPVLASLMSLVPGLGQVYIGYYLQGFINILVVASIITLLSQGETGLTPFLAIFMAFFWLYNIVDASRRATFYNQALDGLAPSELLPEISLPDSSGSLVWGVALMVVGALALSHTLFGISLAWLNRWWPLALVLVGVYLVYKSFSTKTRS